jgi:sec-independent protein translocase protein TatC
MATSVGGRMPLLEHLREFRRRVVRSSIAISFGSIIGWFFYNEIITKLAEPVCDLRAAQASGANNCGALYINGVLGPLNLQIKVAILTGVILSAPIWLYQLWAFIAPALHRREKKNSIFFFIAATPFFVAGTYLGYSILPVAVRVLFGFTPDALNNLVKFDDYLDFVMRAILLFGITGQ